jgi:hypothetical protein
MCAVGIMASQALWVIDFVAHFIGVTLCNSRRSAEQ